MKSYKILQCTQCQLATSNNIKCHDWLSKDFMAHSTQNIVISEKLSRPISWIGLILNNHTYKIKLTHTHSHSTGLCPGLPGWAGTRRDIYQPTPLNMLWESVVILDFMRLRKDNRDKCTDAILTIYAPTSIIPPNKTDKLIKMVA